MTFADIFKELRKKNNMSQQQVADKLGIKQPTVASWEKDGERLPENKTLCEIANLFDVSLDYLCGRTGDTKKVKSLLDAEGIDPNEYNEYLRIIRHAKEDNAKKMKVWRFVKEIALDGDNATALLFFKKVYSSPDALEVIACNRELLNIVVKCANEKGIEID
ncbi:MAG: helix-turn-helix domain-containing protein [Firmicutes bacterium]|nr:helix-turn-helix domain-containing protein [Bacillota bacterium]